MTIYSDAVGNKFLGDCIYANHNIDYPSLGYLVSHPESSISAELSSLCSQAGLSFRNVLSQSGFNASPFSSVLLYFGANGDIDDRYKFVGIWRGGGNTSSDSATGLYNDSGATDTANAINQTTNRLAGTEFPTSSGYGLNGGISALSFTANSTNITPIYYTGVSDSQSLALFLYQKVFSTNATRCAFFYGGKVAYVNTNFNYYSANIVSQSIIFSGSKGTTSDAPSSLILNGRNYVANSAKYILSTGDAQYAIACSDGQTPTSQWATDMYVFDDNSALGFPAIGRVRNLLLAQGTYTIGKPVRIVGTAMPDAGQNSWLPIGSFAGKTVLMRCYTSVAI